MGNYYSKEYNVVLIEFLTKEEKLQKTINLKLFYEKLQSKQDNEDEYDLIGDTFSQYKTSFSQEIKIFQPILTSSQIDLYIKNIEEISGKDKTFEKMAKFFKMNVDQYFVLYEDKEITNLKNFEVNLKKNDQIAVFEILYSKKSWKQRFVYFIENGTKLFWRAIMAFFNLGTIWFVFTSFVNKSMVFKMTLRYFFPIFTLIPI